jgi:Holliday junction resolvasome RuvABC endonuclease subunit
MSTVVGVDPSLTSAGIVAIRDGDPVMITSLGHPGRDGASWVDRARRVRSQGRAVARIVIAREPDLVVIEGPLLHGPNTGSAFDRYALFLCGLVDQLDVARLPIAVVHNQTRATWATGKGESKSKRDVFAAIKAEWPDWVTRHLTNDDRADALVLAAMGAVHLGDTLPIVVPDWRLNNLDAVAWPRW